MASTNVVNFAEHGAEILGALEAVENIIAESGIDSAFDHLIRARASQINGCAYGVNRHIRDARKDGESDERLDHLIVWRRVDDFTAREKAAFAWTEALSELKNEADLAPLRADLKKHFTDKEISTLTAIIAMINLWNRIQISHY